MPMSYRDLPEDLILQVNLSEVRRYAIAQGWQRAEGVNGVIALYQHPESDLDQLIVPLDRSMDDYGRSMADVIARLAVRSGLSPIQILEDLLDAACDLVRFRLDEPDSQRGSIPLAQGISLLGAAERALRSAACSVIQPQAFHPRLGRGEAEQLVRACRMGQTERGSFTLKVACPLDAFHPDSATTPPMPLFDKIIEPDSEPARYGSKEPFTRQVTRLLMASLNRITKAIDSDKTASLLVEGAGQPVLSANLCEAILAMQPIGERSRLAVQTSWSKTFAPPPESVQGVRPISNFIRRDVQDSNRLEWEVMHLVLAVLGSEALKRQREFFNGLALLHASKFSSLTSLITEQPLRTGTSHDQLAHVRARRLRRLNLVPGFRCPFVALAQVGIDGAGVRQVIADDGIDVGQA